MYKFLLSWRYLRTRFIALASIISVTLGVATLIVVNSVMSGFVDEMKTRLHGALSDIEMSASLLSEINYPDYNVEIIRELLKDDVEEVTCVVRTPALLAYKFADRTLTQQIMLVGIDDKTFGKVTDFNPYLQHERKRQQFSFDLEESGYPDTMGISGWAYRRQKESHKRELERLYQEQSNRAVQLQSQFPQSSTEIAQTSYLQETTAPPAETDKDVQLTDGGFQLVPLPTRKAGDIEQAMKNRGSIENDDFKLDGHDPHAHLRAKINPEDMFDPMKDQYTGIILGKAIVTRKDYEGKEHFLIRPGDDVQIMLTTVGDQPKPVSDVCTLVDFYSSNMHEYDSQFAFMPLSELQRTRGMIDPMTQQGSVSTIQIKLAEGADLNACRDQLMARFPHEKYFCEIRTWQDTQRPLLSAVNMELTILNILLFLIIAVAGFGILATFFMIVVEKTRDIGILKALGAPSHGVMSIFLGYGVCLGAVGTGAGILLGLLFVSYINQIAAFVQTITGREIFDPTIYYFSEIPTIVSPLMVVGVALGAIAIAVMASVLPALRAARLHPVEALRYE